MTRKRTRESLAHMLCEPCPTCQGRGQVKTARSVCYDILREILREARQFNPKEFRVVASATVVEMLLDEESQHLAGLTRLHRQADLAVGRADDEAGAVRHRAAVMERVPVTHMIRRWAFAAALACVAAIVTPRAVAATADEGAMAVVDAQIAAHPGQTGVYVLDTGAEALLARAWLVDHAQRTIEVQYFIWSTDNIGILAAEALLRAAERGVRVRVIVDDLLIDAPDQLAAGARAAPEHRHPHLQPADLGRRAAAEARGERGHRLPRLQPAHARQDLRRRRQGRDHRRAQHGGRVLRLQPRVQLPRPRCAAARRGRPARCRQSFEALLAQRPQRAGRVALRRPRPDAEERARRRCRGAADLPRAARLRRDRRRTSRPRCARRSTRRRSPSPRLAQQMRWGEVEFISDRPGKNDTRLRARRRRAIEHGAGAAGRKARSAAS